VWNLAPAILTWRRTASPVIAAGFTSMALTLRIPILFFASARALLLPVLTVSGEAVRVHVRAAWPKWVAAEAGVVVLWAVVAVGAVPVVVRVERGSLHGGGIAPPRRCLRRHEARWPQGFAGAREVEKIESRTPQTSRWFLIARGCGVGVVIVATMVFLRQSGFLCQGPLESAQGRS